MAEFFIVTSQRYQRHSTLEAAAQDMKARQARNPGTRFHVLRCKSSLTGAQHFTKLVALLRDILMDGFNRTNRDRALVLLSTIEHRSGGRLKAGHGGRE